MTRKMTVEQSIEEAAQDQEDSLMTLSQQASPGRDLSLFEEGASQRSLLAPRSVLSLLLPDLL